MKEMIINCCTIAKLRQDFIALKRLFSLGKALQNQATPA